MKRTILGIVLMGLMGAGSLFASDWRSDRELRHDYAVRNDEQRDIARDRQQIAHDQWELHRDLRNGNYAAAQHERAELRNEYRDINQDRRDVRRDDRDIRNDRFHDWR